MDLLFVIFNKNYWSHRKVLVLSLFLLGKYNMFKWNVSYITQNFNISVHKSHTKWETWELSTHGTSTETAFVTPFCVSRVTYLCVMVLVHVKIEKSQVLPMQYTTELRRRVFSCDSSNDQHHAISVCHFEFILWQFCELTLLYKVFKWYKYKNTIEMGWLSFCLFVSQFL